MALVNISQAQCPTAQGKGHIETEFVEAIVEFDNLSAHTKFFRYSSSIFDDGKRSIANCTGFGNILIYDVDNDTDNILSLSTAVELFNGFQSLIVTTKSHQKEKNGVVADRYRILIPLDEAIMVSVNEYSDYYLHIASLLNISEYIDKSCKDAARMYQPNLDQEDYYSSNLTLLSEKQLRISFEEKKFLDNSSRTSVLNTVISLDIDMSSRKDYLQSILYTSNLLDLLKYDEKFKAGYRNSYLYSVGKYLIQGGISLEDVKGVLIWINGLKGSLSEVELNKTVMRSLKL